MVGGGEATVCFRVGGGCVLVPIYPWARQRPLTEELSAAATGLQSPVWRIPSLNLHPNLQNR